MKYFLLLWGALASWGAPAPSEGVVLGITGEWHVKSHPGPRVAFGDPISENDTLEGAQNASVVISWPADSKRFYRKCDAPKCEVNLADPANQAQPAPGILARVAEALKPYFTHGESATKFVAAESRGAEGDLAEAVLLLRAGLVDLAPALKDLVPGAYRLRFEPLTAGAAPGKSFRVDWKPNNRAVETPPGIQPGMCRLAFLDPGTNQPTNNRAWVLVSTPDDYGPRATSFKNMLEATSTWTDELSKPAARSVLRVWLQTMADGTDR